jgi:predicted NAD-dependent protein-ADP-ribosyltransferase YbiA (DUF1768 family)
MIAALLENWPGVIDPARFPVIPFRKVAEPYGWLGNMSSHPLRVPREPGGVLYPTTEHFFQCERFEDPAIRRDICSKTSPMACKMIARRHATAMRIAPRTPEDLDLMRRTIRAKLDNHPGLRRDFLALPAGAVIIEDASRRGGASAAFWGMKLRDGLWSGQNWLGRLWMELRLELQ